MPQSSLPFKYEEEKTRTGLTGLAGLPLYLELLNSLMVLEVMRTSLDSDIDDGIVWNPARRYNGCVIAIRPFLPLL
jgi:hypothetical protein